MANKYIINKKEKFYYIMAHVIFILLKIAWY